MDIFFGNTIDEVAAHKLNKDKVVLAATLDESEIKNYNILLGVVKLHHQQLGAGKFKLTFLTSRQLPDLEIMIWKEKRYAVSVIDMVDVTERYKNYGLKDTRVYKHTCILTNKDKEASEGK